VTVGTPTVKAAKEATATIPIVMAGSADPVEQGLVTSLARPGGNVTGVTHSPGPEIAGKGLELFKEAVPRMSGVAVLWDSRISPIGPSSMSCGKGRRSSGLRSCPTTPRRWTSVQRP
jgi:ABC-type uncharacterized transport system substrate-binding protein